MRTDEHFSLFLAQSQQALAQAGELAPVVAQAAQVLVDCLKAGGKVLVCGNGGSAADAQHFAAELAVRFEKERAPLAAVAITTDTSILTACANDYSFEEVFARQVRALGRRGDVLMAISTSGNSANVLAAMQAARELGMATVALTGRGGGRMAVLQPAALVAVDHTRTALIQQVHEVVLHFLCEDLDRVFAGENSTQ